MSIPTRTELIGIGIIIEAAKELQLPPQYTTALHAWFLDQVRQTNPELSQQLHDGQDEKPFTISGIPEISQTNQLQAHQTYQWQITALNGPLCNWLRAWLKQPLGSLRLNSTTCKIIDRPITQPATTYRKIWQQATHFPSLELTFISPTSFRKRHNHMPLPIPENIFHSYLRRWNHFAPNGFDQTEFLEWVNNSIVILRHDIRSSKVAAGKSGSVTGFTGQVQFGFAPAAKQNPKFQQLAAALIKCAPYFQTGHKVTFGLGQTQAGWNSPPPITPNIITLKTQIFNQRRQELVPLFLAQKKRQGGDRATNSANLWADIIARQEVGDSLTSIAADLKMSYDTVKKYAQLAKKQLAQM
jgi:CRISPR-associated endoribonuclease Cas6